MGDIPGLVEVIAILCAVLQPILRARSNKELMQTLVSTIEPVMTCVLKVGLLKAFVSTLDVDSISELPSQQSCGDGCPSNPVLLFERYLGLMNITQRLLFSLIVSHSDIIPKGVAAALGSASGLSIRARFLVDGDLLLLLGQRLPIEDLDNMEIQCSWRELLAGERVA